MRRFELQYRRKGQKRWRPGHVGLTKYKGKPSRKSIEVEQKAIIDAYTVWTGRRTIIPEDFEFRIVERTVKEKVIEKGTF